MTKLVPLSDPARVRFTAVAIALHWTIAALILTNIGLAWRFLSLEGMKALPLIQVHKTIGMAVLTLTVLRLAWRLTNPPPAYPADMKRWEKAAAHATHWGFYGFMLLTPLTGWMASSASTMGFPIHMIGDVNWPFVPFIHNRPMPERKLLMEPLSEAHRLMTYLGYALIFVHVGAALKHQFVARDTVLWRMLPLSALRRRPAAVQEPA